MQLLDLKMPLFCKSTQFLQTMLMRNLAIYGLCSLSLLASLATASSIDSTAKQPKFTFEIGYYGMVPINGQRLQTSFSRYKPLPTYLRVSFLHKEKSHLSFTFNYFAKVYSPPAGQFAFKQGEIQMIEFENVAIDYNRLLHARKNELSIATGLNFRYGYQHTDPGIGYVVLHLRSLGISLGGTYKINIGKRNFLAIRSNYTYYRQPFGTYIGRAYEGDVVYYAEALRHTANFFLGWGMRLYK
jgi:hypothetical protein